MSAPELSRGERRNGTYYTCQLLLYLRGYLRRQRLRRTGLRSWCRWISSLDSEGARFPRFMTGVRANNELVRQNDHIPAVLFRTRSDVDGQIKKLRRSAADGEDVPRAFWRRGKDESAIKGANALGRH